MPTRMSGKLLNLSVQDWLWRGYGALMRALPRFGAHCQRSSQTLGMLSHPSSAVCAMSHVLLLPELGEQGRKPR